MPFSFVALLRRVFRRRKLATSHQFNMEIEKQQRRLSSSDVEERRDAVMRLGSMRIAAASRAALPGLQDAEPIVRATTAKAILAIGNEESARIPASPPQR